MADIYVVADQAFRLVVVGLKPTTTHSFIFEGQNRTADCAPLGGVKGQNLVSSNGGVMEFTFYYSSGIQPSTDQKALADQYNRIAGTKVIRVQNSDNTSFAQDTLSFLPYSQMPDVNQTTPSNTISIGGGNSDPPWNHGAL